MIGLVAVALAGYAAPGEVSVTDGDGLRIGEECIRLWGIDRWSSTRSAQERESGTPADRRDWFQRGIVWAGTLWSCRQRVGREQVDALILPTWRQAMVPPIQPDAVAARFGAALVAAAPPLGACFREEIARRGLPSRQ